MGLDTAKAEPAAPAPSPSGAPSLPGAPSPPGAPTLPGAPSPPGAPTLPGAPSPAGATPTTRAQTPRPGERGRISSRRRLDRFELAVLAVFALLSLWTLALDIDFAATRNLVWTGTDGFFIVDQLQYLSWIQSAAHHGLIGNLFVLRATPADYFQPAVLISGALTAIGVAPWLSLLVWKPVAVLAIFLAVRAYARHSVEGVWPRRAVLVLGIFFGSFTIVYGAFGVLGDLFPGFLSWGYTFGLIAIAAMLACLVAYDRARRERRLAWAPGVLALLAGLLHPWQGELIAVVIVLAEVAAWLWPVGVWSSRQALWRDPAERWRNLRLPVTTLVLTVLPLLYYELLGRLDLSWKLARVASRHTFSVWGVVLDLVPLILPALLALRLPVRSFLDLLTRVWLLAALVVYVLSSSAVSATPLHAFEGLPVPLAVLAVQGLGAAWPTGPRARRRAAAAAVLALVVVTVPADIYEMAIAPHYMGPQAGNGNFITHDEARALAYLADDPTPGGVLSRFYLGALVPGRTGRRTYVGDCLWSEPHCGIRAEQSEALLEGKLTTPQARALVSGSGARFVLQDCSTHGELSAQLAGLIASTHRFGCATVYTLRQTRAT
jgi:hypothetical protein